MDPREVLDADAARPDLVLLYGDHPDAVIDIFLPSDTAQTPAPLAVLLHGGFWRQEFDRTHLRSLAWALARRGFVVATPEYRRGPGSWPAMSADVTAALAGVRALVDKATPGRIDAEAPFVLAGHSAGGHLALWGGLRAGPTVVAHIVGLAPVTDVAHAARTQMGRGAAHDLLGGEPGDVPDAYQSADALRLFPGPVRITVIQGDEDVQVPVEMNRAIAESLTADSASAPFRYIEQPGVEHFALIDPTSEVWPAVLRAMTAGLT